MHTTDRSHRLAALLLSVAVFAFAGWASADPPARVARLGYTQGAVSFSPAGEEDWVLATLNRPLVTGDRLWADAGARSELQVGNAYIRMGGDTSVTLLNLDDRVAQLQLAQGTLTLRVRRLGPDDVFEIDTPNLAFSVRRIGEYRVDVDPAGNTTAVLVRSGQGEVYGEGASYVVDAQHSYRFAGTGLRDYEQIGAAQPDAFDQWAHERDRRGEASISARYVSPDVIGYEDLDANGTWRAEPDYGNVWVPSRVVAGWSPYYDGHWAWIDPWGWTWVDNAPWGFAVSHYGRWAHLRGSWCWVPGPLQVRAVYAPALVAFVGGTNFQIAISSGNVGGVAWFPLGPREVYRPAYAVSRTYFDNVNRSNTVVNTTIINNSYNNTNVTNVVYANQRVQGAVVAVPTTAFAQSQPVARVATRVSPENVVNVPVAHVASVAPVQTSVLGAAQTARKPPAQDAARPVVVRNAPPAPPPAFAAQQQQLAAKPGVPLDTNTRAALKPATSVAPQPARVVATKQAPAPTAVPPPAPPGRVAQPVADKGQQPPDKGQPPEKGNATAKANQRNESPATVARPPETNVGTPPTPNVANAKQDQRMISPLGSPNNVQPPATTPPETRGPPESRGQSAMARPQAVPRPPTATPAETRGSPESRTQSAMVPPQSVPRAPTVTPPETRGPPETRTQSANARPQSVPRPPTVTPPETRGPPPEPRTQSAMVPQSVARPPATVQPPAVGTPPAQRASPEKAIAAKPPAGPPPTANVPPERSADARRDAPAAQSPAPAERKPAPEAKSAENKREGRNGKEQLKQEERNS